MRFALPLVLVSSLTLSACGEEGAAEAPPPPPVVKYEIVSERASGQIRRISGKVEAADRSALGFQVGGRVLEVNASVGDQVLPGQTLAVLDRTDFQLAVDTARSRLASARARFGDARDDLNRKSALVDNGFVTRAAVDSASASVNAAAADVEVAENDLERALTDLDRTQLLAPFAGTVAVRQIDPFVDVSAGQTLFELDSDAALEIRLLVPETLIRDVDYGQTVSVSFPTLDEQTYAGTVSQIASRAETGNAFTVKVALSDATTADVRAGMTANVAFNFQTYLDGREAYLIPLTAIYLKDARPRDIQQPQAPVFVFNEDSGTVEQRMIEIGDLRGNDIEVYSGLDEGDKIVTAGVAFLYDGMPARLWQPNQ